ncbi:hypothetical protein DFAR_1470047 [Desulfarculales bacterium]
MKAFFDKDCFAGGIDLNSGYDNRYVLSGDFYHLQVANDSVDIVFSNSFDYAFDLNKLMGEVTRVLKPGAFWCWRPASAWMRGARQVFTNTCNGPPWTSSSRS